ncbi:hypothetical protein [Dyella monticola]|uniref:hypothetical protein n=1 Tax=Dyella monticola TaxID=1927958 RepID=UPI00131401FA|nr:hypothetical protein [Dyella monticola]
MSRMGRVHIPQSINFVVLQAETGQTIYANDAEFRHLLHLIGRSAQRSRAHVHAFCCCPQQIRLAIAITDVPLALCIQRIATGQSRYVHRQRGESGHLFRERYRAVVLRSRAWLPALVRSIHRSPCEWALTQDWATYPWSSHRAYATGRRMNGLRTGVMLRMLSTVCSKQREMYRRFTEVDDGDAVVPERLRSPFGSNATADQWLAGCIAQQVKHQRMTLDDAIKAVAQVLDISRAVLLSRARASRLTLARAVVTRYAIRTGVAPLAEVERALGRRRSALYHAITRYEQTNPKLFCKTLDEVNVAALEEACHRDVPPSQHGCQRPTRRERLRRRVASIGRVCSATSAKASLQGAPRGRATR